MGLTLLLAMQVVTGTTFSFDHDPASAADTLRYELCVDVVSDATCQTVAVLRVGTTDTYSFTLPATVPRGNRTLSVRAVGLAGSGTSGPSNALTQRVIGRPDPPTNLRVPVEP
jgi:hypothetical protein